MNTEPKISTYLTTDIHNVVAHPHRCVWDGVPMTMAEDKSTPDGDWKIYQCPKCNRKIQIIDPGLARKLNL